MCAIFINRGLKINMKYILNVPQIFYFYFLWCWRHLNWLLAVLKYPVTGQIRGHKTFPQPSYMHELLCCSQLNDTFVPVFQVSSLLSGSYSVFKWFKLAQQENMCFLCGLTGWSTCGWADMLFVVLYVLMYANNIL